MVIDGVPALPMRPALDSVSNGAVSDPTANPAAAATMATRTYSASSTAATRLGVPPTALRSPTRLVWSAIRPPTSTETLATASRPSSQAPISSRIWASLASSVASSRMSSQDCRRGAARLAAWFASTNAWASSGSASFRFIT